MKKLLLPVALLGLMVVSCSKSDTPAVVTYPAKATSSAATVIYTNTAGVPVYNGGYGSALAMVPGEPGYFYLMTDRGPNVDGITSDIKIFPVPGFTPQIGKFKLENDSLRLVQVIPMSDAAGNKISGRPNPAGAGSTGETGLDMSGKAVATDINGLDPEGLAIAADGSFWVSDEYGPHLVHFDKTGKAIERINPYSSGRKLPNVLKRRRANRGMEGLAITPDGKMLAGMMQSPLYNPSKSAVSKSKNVRMVTFDVQTGATKQYVYVLDDTKTANSEMVALSNTSFLVLERDGDFPGSGSVIKKVYRIDISQATDISDAADSESGKMVNGKTVDEMTDAELAAAGILPVTKTLVADLLTDVPGGYPHDKAEGLAIIDNNTIAVSNDDDFGIVAPATPNNDFVAKILPATGKLDKNTIYFIRLKTPLK
jgi:hypothetical protein